LENPLTITYLNYPLNHGYIHHWLVAGPLALPVSDLDAYPAEDYEKSVLQKYSQSDLEVTIPPVDLGVLGAISNAYPFLYWRYYRCLEDHLVDFSSEYPACQFLRSWAYTILSIPSAIQLSLQIGANGPVEVWLNGENIIPNRLSSQEMGSNIKESKKFSLNSIVNASFKAGENHLLVRFDTIALRQTPYAFALQIQDYFEQNAVINLPTEIEENLLEKRQKLEEVIEHAYLDRYVFGYLGGDRYDKNEPILLHFSSEMEKTGEISHRLQSLRGDIFQSGIKNCEAGSKFELARLFPLRNGPHHLALLPVEHEYYLKKLQFERRDPFWVVRTPFSEKYHGTFQDRVKDTLEDAAKRRNDSIFTEIAKIALGNMENINFKILDSASMRVKTKQDGSISDLLGLLSIILRYSKKVKFPKKMYPAIESTIWSYRYWTDETHLENMDFLSENRQILFHTCEILAGQLYPQVIFAESGYPGSWHQQHGEEMAIVWMRQHGQYGFREWDSPDSIEAVLSALSHLIDLAQSETTRELAAVLMDKIFFSLAINGWKGMLGSSQGYGDTGSVLSHRLEATSGITRLMWGQGNYNESIMGTVSLACCQNYNLPDTIRTIALDTNPAFWNRERSAKPLSGNSTASNMEWEVNKVIYKTSDYMLASVQDYYPGESGSREHIWQATLAPDAVVFVNHPVKISDTVPPPNLWVGNGSLPRVAQWGDVLIALHKLSQDDWMGLTHAYFPASAFDEYSLSGNWAFARKGEGYLAIYAKNGLHWITVGKTAFRELRSYGNENIWLCHMGQQMLDESFSQFKEKILATNINIDRLSIQLRSLRGEDLSFGWTEPLMVNGQSQALSGSHHYENIYCLAELPAQQMNIVIGEEGLRLTF
jgi:hypothetical protein